MASTSSSNTDSSILDARKEVMIHLDTGVTIARDAYFLKPSVVSTTEGSIPAPPLANIFAGSLVSLSNLTVEGWWTPLPGWKEWANTVATEQRNVWTQAGVYDAIANSTCKIQKNNKLILWLAERWCKNTNTFVFPWGEATITLEDVLVLGCFSTVGGPIFDPPMDKEAEELHEELLSARKELGKTTAKKATQSAWLNTFKDKETQIKNAACLVYWLSRFVFPSPATGGVINKDTLRAAISLSKGNKIALGPAVLASLYNDLSKLKDALHTYPEGDDLDGPSTFRLSSPMRLVQVWAWERFSALQLVPRPIAAHEPIMARWEGFGKTDIEDILPSLDSPTTGFLWRPYISLSDARLYGGREPYRRSIIEEVETHIRYMRVSELVSVAGEYTKLYLPHRVAMQFGLDQDIPDRVDHLGASAISTWANYNRPVGNVGIYIPNRFSQTNVTEKYWSWLRSSNVPTHITSTSPHDLAKEFQAKVSALGQVVNLLN